MIGRRSPLAIMLEGLIRLYRMVPKMGDHCRYHPTCSAYGLEAVQVHGGVRGSWLIIRRLSRCHPWGGTGIDPVPPARARRGTPARARRGTPAPAGAGTTAPVRVTSPEEN